MSTQTLSPRTTALRPIALPAPGRERPAGFTLVELLIVISILGLLAVVLLPRVLETRASADDKATMGTMLQLETAAKRFSRKHGVFPPDDLAYLDKSKEAKWRPDNGVNTGIESLVCMVSQSTTDGESLAGLSDHFVNTDGDSHGIKLPLLDRKDRLEIADAFGTPLVYFNSAHMDRPQRVLLMDGGEEVEVRAKKRPDGGYYGGRSFQLLSAGQDRTFGTDDDIVWPEN